MTITVKNKTPLVVPPAIRRRAGLKSGQDLEFKVSGGVITILPKLPTADDEYTPEQRRVIDARLAEGLADIEAGRTFGPFNGADEMIAHMEARATKRTTAKRAKRSRSRLTIPNVPAEPWTASPPSYGRPFISR